MGFMQLLIRDASYPDREDENEAIAREVEACLSEFAPVEVEGTDIGPGADWPMFLAVFSGVATVFLMGEKIEKSLDAWISMSRRFRDLIDRLQQKFGPTRVDMMGACFLALKHIGQDERGVSSLRLLSSSMIPIYTFQTRDSQRLDSRYDSLYLLAIEVNDEWIYTFIIRGGGRIDHVRRYPTGHMDFALDGS